MSLPIPCSGKFGPKLKCAPNFIKFGTQDIFKFLLIRYPILLEDSGMLNVKKFFSRGVLCTQLNI